MFDTARFFSSLFAGTASAGVTRLAGQFMPGSYGVKLAAEVATTAAVTGALHVGGAPDHLRDAAAIGGAGAIMVHASDELSLYSAVKRLGGNDTPSNANNANNANGAGASNASGGSAGAGSASGAGAARSDGALTAGLNDGLRVPLRPRAGVPV